MSSQRDSNGRFKKRLPVWSPATWEAGWINKKTGRFMVYRPDYPRAYGAKYALRYHVVWWLHHGVPHPIGTDLHHGNRDKLDDRLENLELKTHGEHSRLHHFTGGVKRVCENCKQSFSIPQYRLNQGRLARFCSQACYHAFPRSDEHKTHIGRGMKLAYAEGRKQVVRRGKTHK